jgi:hypothetical protein
MSPSNAFDQACYFWFSSEVMVAQCPPTLSNAMNEFLICAQFLPATSTTTFQQPIATNWIGKYPSKTVQGDRAFARRYPHRLDNHLARDLQPGQSTKPVALEARYSEQEQPRLSASKSPPWIGGWWLIGRSWKFWVLSRRLFGRALPVRQIALEDALGCVPRTRATDEAIIWTWIRVL